MNATYKRFLKELYTLQYELVLIEDYEEDDYQALKHAIDYFEDKLDVE